MAIKTLLNLLENALRALPAASFLLLGIAAAQEPTSSVLLDLKIPQPTRADSRVPAQIAADLMFLARVPGGVIDCGDNGPASQIIIPEGMRVGDALTSLMGGQHQYLWREAGGVVNVLPQRGIPDLLQTNISLFEWRSDESPYATVSRLEGTTEVVRRRSQLGFVEGVHGESFLQKPPRVGAPAPMRETGQVFVRRNVILLDLLNEIVKSYRRPAVWRYTETTRGRLREVALRAY